MLKIYAVLLCLLLQVGFVHAESVSKKEVEVLLQQFKVVKQGQSEMLEPVQRIKPGELIEYQVKYRNTSNHALRQLNAILPIPKETEYVPDSAHPQNVQASLDGLTYAPVPLVREVRLSNGEKQIRVVPTAEYRSLRWLIGDLPATQTVTVSARIRLAPLTDSSVVRVKK